MEGGLNELNPLYPHPHPLPQGERGIYRLRMTEEGGKG